MEANTPIKQVIGIAVDFEATGLFPKLGEKNEPPRVIEFGAIQLDSNKTFSQLINPEIKIPENIVQITKITNEMTKDTPTFKLVWKNFQKWALESVNGNTKDNICVFIGHNITYYDIPLLNAECERLGIKKKKWKFFDTLILSRSLWKKMYGNQTYTQNFHSLENLTKNFNIKSTNSHRALSDAKATAKLFKFFTKGLSKEEINKCLINNNVTKLVLKITELGNFSFYINSSTVK